jgi:putative ABC transport system permease protein
MSGIFQDIRYAFRQLLKSPGFAVVAVLTLALGIGANTAIYSLLDQALLRTLPVKDPGGLVQMRYTGSNTGHVGSYGGGDENYFSYPMYRDLRDQNSVFSGLLATDEASIGIQWHNQPDLVSGELVSGNYFDVLGVRPALGRLFVPSDDQVPEANPVAVLSFGYWQRRFGSDPQIVNQSILVNDHPFTVIGIAEPGFRSVVLGNAPDIFVPMMMKPQITPDRNDLADRRSAWLNIIGRLKPGLGREQAEAGITPLWKSIRADELKEIDNKTEQFRVNFVDKSSLSLLDGSRGFSPLRDDIRAPLLIIMAMVGLVALIACANVASLLLVRAAGRVREMSVRYALGAKRQRVLQQLLVEGMLLGVAGGLLGVLLARPASSVLIRMLFNGSQGDLPFSANPDLRVLVFNFALAVLVSVFFGLAPAIQFWRPDLVPALKEQASTVTGGASRFRRISVAIQIGLSVVVLVGAGLFVRTLHNLKSLNVGFATDHLVIFRINPRLAGYEPARTLALYKRVLETMRSLPSIRSVAATDDPELDNDDRSSNITIAGYAEKPLENMDVEHSNVTPGYFSTLEMPLLAGRSLTDDDAAGTANAAVVNESFARHFFQDPQQAVGHFYGWGGGNVKTDIEIVGVVKDAIHANLRDHVRRTAFASYLQTNPASMTFYVRTWQAPEAAESTIRRAMQELDSKIVLGSFRTMDEQIDITLSSERLVALLAASFGILAALMAGVGLYGVLAYSTAQRTREIGIRMALGAGKASVVRMVLTEVLWLTGVSIVVALPLSLLLTRAVRSQLFGISSSDPFTFVLVTLMVATVAIVAALIPARRASRVDPMRALRYE